MTAKTIKKADLDKRPAEPKEEPKPSLGDFVIETRKAWLNSEQSMRKNNVSKDVVLQMLGG